MNLSSIIKGNIRLFGVFLFGLFLLVGCLGFSHTTMAGHEGGHMTSNCPIMPVGHSLCQMNPLEHISAWQDTVTALPIQFVNVLLALLIGIASSFVAHSLLSSFRSFLRSFYIPPPLLYVGIFVPITTPLQEAFSNGILHSKVF